MHWKYKQHTAQEVTNYNHLNHTAKSIYTIKYVYETTHLTEVKSMYITCF